MRFNPSKNRSRNCRQNVTPHIAKLRKDHFLSSPATIIRSLWALQESALGNDEWLLEYEVTDYGVAIYLAKGKRMVKALFKPIQVKALDELVRKVREPLEIVPAERQRPGKAESI